MKCLLPVLTLLFLTAGPDAAPPRVWKDPEEGEALFTKAVADFEAGAYRELAEACKKLRNQAKDAPTRALVASYLSAAEGGVQLAVFRDHAAKGKKHAAYADALKAAPRYEGTPIAAAYASFLSELREELFTVLEDFEKSGARYSEKYGKSFVDHPQFVKQGRQSLKWETDSKNVSLKVEALPKNLQDHLGVSLWVNFPAGTAPFRLIFACEGKSTGSTQSESAQDSFYKAVTAQRGWTRLEVEWKAFSQQGAADWSKVEDFRIQFDGRPNITLYVDDICLMKKSDGF